MTADSWPSHVRLVLRQIHAQLRTFWRTPIALFFTIMLPLIESLWLRPGPFMRRAGETLSQTYQIDRHAEALAAIVKRDAEALKAAIAADIRDGTGYLGRGHFERIAALGKTG